MMSKFSISPEKISALEEKYEINNNERKLKNFLKTFAFFALVLMSIYHFYASGFGTIRDILHRGIHISFVLGLVFIFYSWKKLENDKSNYKFPYLDLIFSILAVVTALYLPLLPPEILASRVGNPTNTEVVMGSILIILTLEAARRSIGFTLPLICLIFILFALYGPYFPGALKHGGSSWVGFVNHIYITNQGIYGIAVGVMAQYVFLFILLWLAFFSSFAVKTPMWPVHTWLPDAHVEAPTAGSVLLAAILLKMAGYGFIRFSLGLFPIASEYFVPLIYTLSLIAIVYTSLVALMQEDMKKLIAYSSVAHMGFVTLGIFTMTGQGIEGSIFQMISHGLVSAALFLCVGVVYERHHTRLISKYGGLVSIMPRYAIVFMVFTLAAIGLPGTSGFVGEFLVLMGTFKKNFLVATIASLGVILGAAYMLWLYKRIIFGEIVNEDLKSMLDLKRFEILILFSLVIPIIFFGFYPEPLMNSIEASVENVLDMYNLNITNNLAYKN